MEITDIKAGTYLLVAAYWDEYLSKPGEPFDFRRHRRGEVLDLNVDDARRLVTAQAVIPHDPANPTHAVNPDGTIVELLPPNPVETGMVLSEEHLAALSDELGISATATSEEILAAVQRLQADRARAASLAESASEAAQRLEREAAQARETAARLQRDAAAAAERKAADRPESDRIDDILKWVGTDTTRATTALEGERSTKGDKARPQLVSALEEILTAPGGDS